MIALTQSLLNRLIAAFARPDRAKAALPATPRARRSRLARTARGAADQLHLSMISPRG